MSGMKTLKEHIEQCIVESYGTDPCTVCGHDLEELGEWVDICKDIAEMEMYEAKTGKIKCECEKACSVSGIVDSLEDMIDEKLASMTIGEKNELKADLTAIIANIK